MIGLLFQIIPSVELPLRNYATGIFALELLLILACVMLVPFVTALELHWFGFELLLTTQSKSNAHPGP
jgi:hypothetical protein